MRRILLLAVLSISLVLGLAACTEGQTGTGSVVVNNQQAGINVTGQGKVTVEPDLAMLTLGVESQAQTVAVAQADTTDAMNKVMAALSQNGVANKDIQTQRYSINVVTRYDSTTQRNVTVGYLVTNLVIVKLRVLDRVGEVIDAVAAAGGDATRVNGISFTVEDPTDDYNQARSLAMTDAKNRANQLASLGGVSLGKPVYVTETTSFPIVKGVSAAPVPEGTSISPGEIDIITSVQVTYSIK